MVDLQIRKLCNYYLNKNSFGFYPYAKNFLFGFLILSDFSDFLKAIIASKLYHFK